MAAFTSVAAVVQGRLCRRRTEASGTPEDLVCAFLNVRTGLEAPIKSAGSVPLRLRGNDWLPTPECSIGIA